jgi:nucleotide-binding universal stress UspA family protein
VPTSTPIAPYGPGPDDVLVTTDPEPDPAAAGRPPTRPVLVGVDGGECALGAVRWAAEEALRREAPLRILHAAPYLGRQVEPGTIPPELPRARRITGHAYTVARHTAAALHAETEVVPVEPVPALLKAAEEAQLVVLGISTTGAPDELVLAPVAEKVVARSPTPVVVVPRPRRTTPTGLPVVALLGLGDPDDDTRGAVWAAGAARSGGTPLTVVETKGGRGNGEVASVDWAERFSDLDVAVRDMPGVSPGDLLLGTGPATLVVFSAGHGGFLHRLLDGPHRYLLRHCTSPMALVPSVHRSEGEPREGIAARG